MCVSALDSQFGFALDSTNLDNEDGEAGGAGGEGDGEVLHVHHAVSQDRTVDVGVATHVRGEVPQKEAEFLAGILSAIEPEAMSQLYTTRNGLMVLTVMVVMEVLGFMSIKRITRIDA